jgi:hypothetical protein
MTTAMAVLFQPTLTRPPAEERSLRRITRVCSRKLQLFVFAAGGALHHGEAGGLGLRYGRSLGHTRCMGRQGAFRAHRLSTSRAGGEQRARRRLHQIEPCAAQATRGIDRFIGANRHGRGARSRNDHCGVASSSRTNPEASNSACTISESATCVVRRLVSDITARRVSA